LFNRVEEFFGRKNQRGICSFYVVGFAGDVLYLPVKERLVFHSGADIVTGVVDGVKVNILVEPFSIVSNPIQPVNANQST